jgi:hypothetical protein
VFGHNRQEKKIVSGYPLPVSEWILMSPAQDLQV